jgi:retinol dehydrogenase 12
MILTVYQKFLFRYSIDDGALTQLRAGTDPDAVNWNGEYMKPWARVGDAHKNTKDEALQRQIWEYMEEQTAAYR